MVEARQSCYDAAVAFARWDPLRDLLALEHRMDRLASSDGPGWTPAVDLYETADAYVLTAEVPGLSRREIDISVQDGTITIRGERRSGPVPCEQYHCVERGQGAFSRSFKLPGAVEVEVISADLAAGVLTIRVPKSAEAGPRRIQVQ